MSCERSHEGVIVVIDMSRANNRASLLPFLRRIACDNSDEPRKVEFWVKKFVESLQQAIEY